MVVVAMMIEEKHSRLEGKISYFNPIPGNGTVSCVVSIFITRFCIHFNESMNEWSECQRIASMNWTHVCVRNAYLKQSENKNPNPHTHLRKWNLVNTFVLHAFFLCRFLLLLLVLAKSTDNTKIRMHMCNMISSTWYWFVFLLYPRLIFGFCCLWDAEEEEVKEKNCCFGVHNGWQLGVQRRTMLELVDIQTEKKTGR